MSDDHFHVHGAHDHQLEHAAEHGAGDPFSGRIAVTTAILATLGAVMSYQGGATQSDAALFKNNAAILKTEAADQWAYFQSKGNKQNLAELGATLVTTPDKQEFYRQEVEKYKKEKAEIQDKAEKIEAQSKAADEQSEASLHVHHRWALGATAMQVAIALSAIALLTRRPWLMYGVYGVAALGLALGAAAVLHV
jgi:hypothetical protein